MEHEVTIIDDQHDHNLHDVDLLLGWDFYQKFRLTMTHTHVILPGEQIPLIKKIAGTGNIRIKHGRVNDDWGHILRTTYERTKEAPIGLPETPVVVPGEGEDMIISATVEVMQKTTIPPKKAMMVPCRVTTSLRGEFSTPRQFMDNTLTTCSSTVHDMNLEPVIVLTIQNDSTMSRTLKRGQPLAINLQTHQEQKPEVMSDDPILYEKEWTEMADRVVAQSDNLDEEGKRTLRALLEEFKDVFRLKTDKPGRIEQYAVPIHLTTPVPICLAQYQLSALDIKEVNKQVASMLRAGVIEPSTSPYNFPVLLADKKIIANEVVEIRDRRFCIDLRALNAITEKINFPMPTCDHTIHRLKGSRFIHVSIFCQVFGICHSPTIRANASRFRHRRVISNSRCCPLAGSTHRFGFRGLPRPVLRTLIVSVARPTSMTSSCFRKKWMITFNTSGKS
jgi:hypothetical protein